MPFRLLSAESTDLFTGSRDEPRHVPRVAKDGREWRRPPSPERPAHRHVRHRLFDTPEAACAATLPALEPLGLITLDSPPSAIADAIRAHPYGTLVGPIDGARGRHVATARPETAAPQRHTTLQNAETTPGTKPLGSAPSGAATSGTTAFGTTGTVAALRPDTLVLEDTVQPPHHTAVAGSSPGLHHHPLLLEAARRKAFARCLDDMRAKKVRLVPALEHPGDPRQPDNHHKH
ncbi:hypothetical protein GCM10022224_100510 [Nonomuraea antimicrobica]|uniref:[acyl-carrier-protein] S-malonyltransferase n=1 Tax=Nonomuraea antimicrobica TaxID=561173 RepID=A0ABP7EFT7_9ACTN